MTFQRMRQRKAAAAAGKTVTLVQGGEVQGVRESGADLNVISDNVREAKQARGESTDLEGIPTRTAFPRDRRENLDVDFDAERKPGQTYAETNPDAKPTSPKVPREKQQVKVAMKPLVEGDEPNKDADPGNEENPAIPPQAPLEDQNPPSAEELESLQEGAEAKGGAVTSEGQDGLEGGGAGADSDESSEEAKAKDDIYSRKWLLRELKELEEPELLDLANARDIALPPGIKKADIADIIFQNQKESL